MRSGVRRGPTEYRQRSRLSVYTVRHTEDVHCGAGIHRGEGMFEMGGFIVHFLGREMVERLARGFEILGIDEFEEGGLPRKLFRVTLRKSSLEDAVRRRATLSGVFY